MSTRSILHWLAILAFAGNSLVAAYAATQSRYGPVVFFSLWSLYWMATAIKNQPTIP